MDLQSGLSEDGDWRLRTIASNIEKEENRNNTSNIEKEKRENKNNMNNVEKVERF
jgi:hypothetical protein